MNQASKPQAFSVPQCLSVSVVNPNHGVLVWTHRFEPFGKTIELLEDPDGDNESVRLNLRFPGQYYDQESGLHYNWNRYYEPESGRYLTPDALIATGKPIRPYAYGIGNPLRFTDRTGLASDGVPPGDAIWGCAPSTACAPASQIDTLCASNCLTCCAEAVLPPGSDAMGVVAEAVLWDCVAYCKFNCKETWKNACNPNDPKPKEPTPPPSGGSGGGGGCCGC